jgi:hypothetical protein
LDNTSGIKSLIAWSFYSQGSSEDKQTTATPFFSHAFEKLSATRTEFSSNEDKGEYLADLLIQHDCTLILDGLEPLQYAGKGMRGELKDRALRQLFKSLLARNLPPSNLCIITSRITVYELSGRSNVVSADLNNLEVEDGVKLLKSLKVKGSNVELRKTVSEYDCHALALSLLGNAIYTYLDGDVLKRDTLDELIDDYDEIGRHAFKVMQAYKNWLADTSELKLLYILGLFDHPVELDVLDVLWAAQIPDLTEGVNKKAWKVAIRDLREKHRMLSVQDEGSYAYDCHPLIREYFGKQLQQEYPEAWKEAHNCLYEYYKNLPEKEFPDTLEEMQPLFQAVSHGCLAGLYQQVVDEVYWPRISRKKESYLEKKIGEVSISLSLMSHFFSRPWEDLESGLEWKWQVAIKNWAGFGLRANGRFTEALEVVKSSTKSLMVRQSWDGVAINMSGISDIQLCLGDMNEALESAHKAVEYADKAKDTYQQMSRKSVLGHVLHQVGDLGGAKKIFREADKIQRIGQPSMPSLYGVQGYFYGELLLSTGKA